MRAPKQILPAWILGVALTLLLLSAAAFDWYPLQVLEYKSYDFRMRLRERAASNQVAIITIDDQSIANIGRWPWPRSYMAEMVDLLGLAGATEVGLNILYTEPDQNTGLLAIRSIRGEFEFLPGFDSDSQLSSIYESLLLAEQMLDNDARLSQAIVEAGNVTLPLYFTLGVQSGNSAPDLPDWLRQNSIADDGARAPTAAVEITTPAGEFAAGARALGHTNIINDEDGAVRREALFVAHGNRLYPSLALQATMRHLNFRAQDLSVGPDNTISVGRLAIPVDAQLRMLVSYSGPSGSYPYYSFLDVISQRVSPKTFKNKIVLIGHTATGMAPAQVTPMQGGFPAIEIIANVIGNLLDKNFLVRPDWARYADPAVLLVFGLFIAFGLPRTRAGLGAVLTGVLLLLWNGVCIYLFTEQGLSLAMVPPTLLLILGYTMTVSQRFMVTEKGKELVEADSIETNKMLGLSFQGQGMLDLAFEKFRRCPIDDESVKELLYNLALDFERKRMFNKAEAIYGHILQAGDYKDIGARRETLKAAGETMIFGRTGGGRNEATVMLAGASTKPTLGRYEVQKELGRGAMGTVYLGKDPKINRLVAIKTIRFEEVEADQLDEVKQRFFREAEAAGALSHPNIVTIFDVGEDYELAYVAMELLDGSDLTTYTAKDKRLPAKEVLRIVRGVAAGLDFAHGKGVVHRDIKPANIMLLKNGEVKIADFGIARVMSTSNTQTGTVLGTPSYMSPEQVQGRKVDGRSDLFSLGGVLFELLAGQKPYTADSIATLMYNIANKPPPLITRVDPSIPQCCAYIAHRLLTRDLDKRYQRGQEVVAHIDLCLRKLG